MDEVTVHLEDLTVEAQPQGANPTIPTADALHSAILLALRNHPEVARFVPDGATMGIEIPAMLIGGAEEVIE